MPKVINEIRGCITSSKRVKMELHDARFLESHMHASMPDLMHTV